MLVKTDIFKGIVGQGTAKPLLITALEQNKIANAYLFASNVSGVGKYKTALAFARSLTDNYLDILEIEPNYAESSQTACNPSIKASRISEIIDFLATRSFNSRKVVIIKDAEYLNNIAANKLLKTLEDPKTGIFILISAQPQNLLPTVISRCQVINFTRLSNSEVLLVLENEGFTLDHEALLAISSGSPGQAIANQNMLETIPGWIIQELESPPRDILSAIKLSNHVSAWEYSTQVWFLKYLQYKWWGKFRSAPQQDKFTTARKRFSSNVNPKNIWDALLLP
jgi:DNA polymerase-3 subunit delta'